MSEPTVADFTMQYDAYRTFPFVEDETGGITGYGHQDVAAFVQAIHDYDRVCAANSDPAEDEFQEDYVVEHKWAVVDGEHLYPCTADAPGAVPITTVWGQR